jgi:ligand-binding sensor domain-containing protein
MLAGATGSKAQALHLTADLRFDNFNNSNHFVNTYVEHALADSKGYIWACSNGVYRFDGIKTTHFSSFEKKRHHLKNDYTAGLLEDEQGRLWLASSGGLSYYDPAKDAFIYLHIDARRRVSYAFGLSKRKNEIWFTCNYGLCKVDLQTLQVSTTSLDDLVLGIQTFPVNDSMIWLSAKEAFYVYNSRRNSYKKLVWKINGRVLYITRFRVAKTGYYLATTTGLFFWTGTAAAPVLIKNTKDQIVSDLAFHPLDSAQKYLWLATVRNGVIILNTQTNKIDYKYRHNEDDPYSISSNEVSSIHIDSKGMLLFATALGISTIDFSNQHMKERLVNFHNDRQSDQVIRDIVQDRFNPKQVWMTLDQSDAMCIDWPTKDLLRRYKDIGKGYLIEDMVQIDPETWLMLTRVELFVWSRLKGRIHSIRRFPVSDKNQAFLRLNNIIEAGKGRFFITSNKGLFEYHLAGHTLQCVAEKKDDEVNSCFDLHPGVYDNRQQLWVASRYGLFYYNILTHQYRNYLYTGHSDIDHANFYLDIDFNDQGKLFLASNVGLRIFDTANRSFGFTGAFGDINDPRCLSVLCDRKDVWISSNAGLLHFDAHKGTGKVVTNNDESAISWTSAQRFTRVNNEIVTGLRNGYGYFNAAGLTGSQQPSAPYIESVSINNEIADSLLHPQKKIVLPWQANSISFSFTAFEYTDPTHIRFRYKLTGADTAWTYPDGLRSANYLKLPPGRYSFLLQSGNKQNKWNEQTVTYTFEIEPPFWQTWWFKGALALAFVVLVVSTALVKIKSIRKKEQQKTAIYKEMSDLELKALRSQMNPHFIFNSLNSIQKYILNNKQADAIDYLTRFSKLMRLILNNSMHRQVTLEAELAALQLYIELEHRRCGDKFSYEVHMDQQLLPAQILIQPMLLQPYVENAIWHGLMGKEGRGKLQVWIHMGDSSTITCIIEDDGIGREKAAAIKNRKQGNGVVSHGMQLTGRRLNLADAHHRSGQVNIEDLADEQGNATGTKIILQIPVETFQKIG